MSEQSGHADAQQLVGPDVIERARQFELFSRFRVEGFMQGTGASPLKGASTEFLQHRPYMPGDELRHVDWRVYGRTGRLYVREYEEQTSTPISVILDTSDSMRYRAPDGQWSKHEFGVRCAALIAYMSYLARDSVSLSVFASSHTAQLPPGSGRPQLHRMLVTLAGLEPGGGTDFVGALGEAVNRIRRRGLTVVISDFMDDAERIAKVLARLRHRGGDVIAMQVYDPTERELEFSSITRFHDLEGDQVLALDPQLISEQYRDTFDAHTRELGEACRRHGFDHVPLPVADAWDEPLLAYVRRRAEMLS